MYVVQYQRIMSLILKENKNAIRLINDVKICDEPESALVVCLCQAIQGLPSL